MNDSVSKIVGLGRKVLKENEKVGWPSPTHTTDAKCFCLKCFISRQRDLGSVVEII